MLTQKEPEQQEGHHPQVVDPRILRSWQFQSTGKVSAAAVLLDLKAEHMHSGECCSKEARPRTACCQEGGCSRFWRPLLCCSGGPRALEQKARKEIARHQLEDTFYMVDLGNVTRLYKVASLPGRGVDGRRMRTGLPRDPSACLKFSLRHGSMLCRASRMPAALALLSCLHTEGWPCHAPHVAGSTVCQPPAA